MDNETLEGNKLIAEFMGMNFLSTHFDSAGYEQYSYSVSDEISKQVYGYTGATTFLDNQFNSSFDWLMPVVEKIIELKNIYGVYAEISKVAEALLLIDIKVLWLAVVEFIKWYNQNK